MRWVHWTDFVIAPPRYVGVTGSNLVDYDSNTVSYTLGLGRKFNDKWSGAAILGYESGDGNRTGNLGPTDGYSSIALAATYQATDNVKVTGAVRYVDIGDAKSNPFAGRSAATFRATRALVSASRRHQLLILPTGLVKPRPHPGRGFHCPHRAPSLTPGPQCRGRRHDLSHL